jgi:hypothetical protein
MISEHFVGHRRQRVMARCERKHGRAFCWVQIVHAKINYVTTTCAARNKVQVLHMIGTEEVPRFWDLGLHEKK